MSVSDRRDGAASASSPESSPSASSDASSASSSSAAAPGTPRPTPHGSVRDRLAHDNPMRGRVVSDGEGRASLGNIANIITVVRILLAPVFIWMLLADGGDDGLLRWLAAVLFLVAILTDSVDGFLARRQNLVTDFGKLVDPIADKILVGGALVALSILGPWWLWIPTALILLREVGITVFRFIALRDRVIAASMAGKVKTWAQSVAVTAMLVPLENLVGGWWVWVGWVILLIAAVLTVVSGIEYLVEAWRIGRDRRTAASATA